jgi:hypothetical protein
VRRLDATTLETRASREIDLGGTLELIPAAAVEVVVASLTNG